MVKHIEQSVRKCRNCKKPRLTSHSRIHHVENLLLAILYSGITQVSIVTTAITRGAEALKTAASHRVGSFTTTSFLLVQKPSKQRHSQVPND